MGSRRFSKSWLWAAAGVFSIATAGSAELALAKEYVVKLKDRGLDFTSAAVDFGIATKTNVADQHEQGRLLKVVLNDDDRRAEAAALARLFKSPDVEYVVENVKFHTFATVNDPRYKDQWALAKVNAERAWDTTTGSKNVVVAVIDTGIDTRHEDLAANIWINSDEIAGNKIDDDGNGFVDDVNGWDFRDNDADPMDLTSDKNPGHGTHCAGIVGAVGNNGKGISGMSQSVSMMAVRFLGADGSGDLMTAAKAIDYAVNNGAHVISASWGAAVPRSAVEPILEAIKRAEAKNVIFVAAAANDGKSNDSTEVYPANGGLPNMISVAASQSDDSKPSWSNFGKMKVDLASPGHQILSTLPGNKYDNLSGTSMATPLVSGLVALLLSQHNEDTALTGPVVRSLLQASGTQVAIETACNCRVDAAGALAMLQDKKLTVVPNAITIAPQGTVQFAAFGGTAPYKFSVADSNIAGMTPEGAFTGSAEGETKVTVTDATGASATSLVVRVAKAPEQSAECPLGDPMMCMLMCVIQPDLPWCQGGGTPPLPIP
jgi:thermitase